ncbi:MAG TPA: tetratricopeptide repeat protein [Phycisphaerales bacterium]|nr:tetratricopeptide repeat protein [Phycisphaerales bacterium]
MAGNVNTKFVVGLTAGAAVVIGGLSYTAYVLLQNSGADLARMGDQKMAAKQYKEAADTYAKAVNKEKTNTEFLRKWITALKQTNRESQRSYSDAFHKELALSVRQLALVSDQIADKREYFELRQDMLESMPFYKEGYEDVIADADLILSKYPAPSAESESLRRYRGMARLRIALNTPDAPKELVEGAKADLEAALAAAPGDQDSAQWLAVWHGLAANKAATANNLDEANKHMASAEKVITDFLAKNPGNALATIVQTRQELDRRMRELAQRTDKPSADEVRELNRQLVAAMKPRIEAAAELARAQATTLPLRGIQMLRELEGSIDAAAGFSRTEGIVRAALQARPADADLHMLLADFASTRKEHEDAIGILQKVIDMPVPPLSVEGQLLFSKKADARVRQGQAIFQVYRGITEAADRDKSIARMRKLRDELVAQVDASTPGAMLTDAQLAIMEGDLTKADRLLTQFNRDTRGSMIDAMMLAAEVSVMRNEPGAAKTQLENVVRAQPNNILAVARLAEVEMMLRNYARAEQLLTWVQSTQPNNQAIKQQLEVLRGHVKGEQVSDPILQVVLEVDKMTRELSNDPTGPAKVVAKVRADMDRLKSTDPRLYRTLAMAEIRNNNKAGALDAIRKGLEANPGHAELRYFEVSLAENDPLKQRLELNRMATANDEVERLLNEYNIYTEFNKKADARAALDKAKQTAPNDKRVVEIDFISAVEDKDWTRAEELAARGQRENVDAIDGATFRARLESAKGNAETAVTVLQQATGRGGVQPETWRLLGHLQLKAGRVTDAIASFRQALALRPDDVGAIKDLVSAQMRSGQLDDALTSARNYEQFASGDGDFVHMWLILEATVPGGDRAKALQRRTQLYQVSPEDRDNAIALASIHMDSDRTKARPIIDDLMQRAPGLDVVGLDAAWHWADRNAARAREVFENYIKQQEAAGKLNADSFVAYAQFLMQRQDVEGGLAILDRARPFQDKATANIDRAIADSCMALNKLDRAAEACRQILAAKADTPNRIYEKRLAECYLQLGKFTEASAIVTPMLTAPDLDAVTILVAAEIKNQQKDAKGRMDLLDRAVARFPQDASVFMRRGQAIMESAAGKQADEARPLFRAAEADLTQAVKLNPQLWQALRLRAMVYKDLSDPERAINDLKAALDIYPHDNELLSGLIAYMLENSREQEALEVADRALTKRQRDVGAFTMVAQVFAIRDRWSQAVRFMERAYSIDPSDTTALRYLDTLLSAKPQPFAADAERVLNSAQLKARVASNPGLLMVQARIAMLQNKSAQALRSAADALAIVPSDDPRMMLQWYGELRRILPERSAQRSFLEDLMNSGRSTEWASFFRGMLMMEDTAVREQGFEVMKQLLRTSQNKPLRQMVHRTYSSNLYAAERYPEAAAAMQAGLAEFPDDLEVMNNLAYTLVKRTSQPAEALKLAQQVAEKNPTADVLDTLAVCYLKTGDKDKALATIARAEGMQMSPLTAVSVFMHKAEILDALGRKDDARKAIADAVKIQENNPSAIPAQSKTDLEEVRKRIGSA